jgi:uncharacterized protein (UPF0332 family)
MFDYEFRNINVYKGEKMTKEELEKIIKEIEIYVDKMSYADIVDNPKKDLVKILKRSDKE